MIDPIVPSAQPGQLGLSDFSGNPANAAMLNGGEPGIEPKPTGGAEKSAAPYGAAPACGAKPGESERNGLDIQRFTALLLQAQGEAIGAGAPAIPLETGFDTSPDEQSRATADCWRASGAAGWYRWSSAGGLKLGAGDPGGSAGNALQILERHTLWQLGATAPAAQIQAWCQDKRVQAALAGRTPREAVELSELLSDVARDKLDLAEALWRFRSRNDQAKRWFDDHPAHEQRAAMIAVVALSGANCQHVLDARSMLLRLIDQDATGLGPAHAPVFDPHRGQCTGECRARIVGGSELPAFGQSSVGCVELNNPRLRDDVLSYVWQSYGQLRRSLLSWLCYLGGSDDRPIRNRAAEIAALFARFDHQQVYHEVLAIWAAHELPEVRFTAALGLAYLASDADSEWNALRLTQDLAGSTLSVCKLAAATAYGGGVGVCFPDQALVDLATLALHGQADAPELDDEIGQSVVNLFELNCAAQVIAALSQWVAVSRSDKLAILGAKVFLNISNIIDAAPGGAAWPRLLWLADTRPADRDQVVEIWRRLISMPWARRAALDALRSWIVCADAEPEIYAAIERVVGELFARGTARERERLLFYLRQWARSHGSRKASRAAVRLLAAVMQIP